jgi:hypothetical protein
VDRLRIEQPKTHETIDRRQTAGPKHVSEKMDAFLGVSKTAGSNSLPPSQIALFARSASSASTTCFACAVVSASNQRVAGS